MSIIKDIFGKDNGITENDLNNIVGKYQETSIIECKLVSDMAKNGSAYHNVIKTVIGFLNKPENDSAGLLIIGMNAPNGIIKNIVPIKNNDFMQNTLRNKLIEDIKSIPPINRYTLNIISVPMKEGYVSLVEVHKTDPNAVFYSKKENTAYIRHSDTTINWDLGDVFKTAMSKNYPIVYTDLILKPIMQISEGISKYSVNTILRNDGTSPGKDVVIILKFPNLINSKISLTDISGYVTSLTEPPYDKQLESYVLNRNSKPIYPNLNLVLGGFAIKLANDSNLIIDVFTYEYHGITIQRFVLGNGNISKLPYNFTPYLYLEH